MLYEINEKVIRLENEGNRIIKLNLADPDQQTPFKIIEAAFEAMKQGKTKYASSVGETKLREELARLHDVSPNDVVITPGSKWAVFSIMFLLLKKGGNIVIPTPYWSTYALVARLLGAESRYLKTDIDSNWKIDIEKLESLIDKETRLIVLNNPNNPTSKIIDPRVLERIIQIAEEKGTKIMSDEAYADISFTKTKSILDFSHDHMLVKSFSKTFAMTGWRIGYAIVQKEVAEKMVKLNQISLTNVPVFIQEAALKALELKEQIIETIRENYLRRVDLACNIFSTTKMKFSRPDAPFFLFPRYEGLDSDRFALDLLDKGVAVVPGTAFGDYREHFRIALTAPDEQIKQGLKRICEGLP